MRPDRVVLMLAVLLLPWVAGAFPALEPLPWLLPNGERMPPEGPVTWLTVRARAVAHRSNTSRSRPGSPASAVGAEALP